jgi:membrane-associated phospholipid phosphatase
VAVLVPATLLGLLYLVAVRTREGQHLDEQLQQLAQDLLPFGLGRDLSFFSRELFPWALVLLVAAFSTVAARYRRWPSLVAAGATVVVSAVLTVLLQEVVLERPALVASLHPDNTLPSGHVTGTVALWVAAVLVWPEPLPRYVPAVSVAVPLLACAGSVTGGTHRPSDVIASVLLVAAVAAAARWATRAPLPVLT